MVKSLVGLERKNNIPSLISRCNEGSLPDSLFLATPLSYRYHRLSRFTPLLITQPALSREKMAHQTAAGYSPGPLAFIGSKEAKT
ncbi:hypothetical protein [Serratia ficaria]|uniref:hypothetical protein n=1 Tax=Serratia ficaria TaxID=61651 RepID=UPI0012B71144|nr:hypothetical protein [Serratia ficaria]